MATTTQTITRALKKETRMLDYIYDENYTQSSKRDHDRMTFKVQTDRRNLDRVPLYRNLFSELPHYPRCQVKVNCPFPAHMAREWRASASQRRQSWIRYQTLNYGLSGRVPTQDSTDANKLDVGGRNWYLYNAYTSRGFPRQRKTQSSQSTLPESSTEDDVMKTVDTQTDYRDSDAQTEPYSPFYVIPSGEAPEILSLATLSWGKGLPAGIEEVQMIGRLRNKRAWEASLQTLKNSSQLEERRKLMIIFEAKEWLVREKHIERLQEAKLDVLKQMLAHREELHQKRTSKALDKIWSHKQKEKEVKVKKIRNEHVKAIRKVREHRAHAPPESKARKIHQEYADPGSQVFAPMTRFGSFVDRNSELYVVTSKHLSTYQELDIPYETESSEYSDTTATTGISQIMRYSVFRQYGDPTEGSISTSKANSRKTSLRKMQKCLQFNQTITRPTTPENKMLEDYPRKITEAEHEERVTDAVTLLQQVIRGRGVQNRMVEDKVKYRALINEVKASIIFDDAIDQKMKKHKKFLTGTLQEKRVRNEHKENLVNQALEELESLSLGQSLDFLSKELVRLQEERRIHAFTILCDRHRRELEASEGRKRQEEMRRRAEEDEILKEILKVHQCTVDGCLEQIISSTVDQISEEQSKFEIQCQAEVINQLAYEAEENRDRIASEEIVADLVHSFLIPEAKKVFIREKAKSTIIQAGHVVDDVASVQKIARSTNMEAASTSCV